MRRFHHVATAATLLTASGSALAQQAILLHSYDFDQDARDGTGSANGVLVGGASITNGHLVTNGVDGHVQFATNLIPVQGAFSVAMSFKTTSVSDWSELISQGCYYCPGFSFGRGIYGTFRINPMTHPGIPSVPYDSLVGAWHHVVLISDPTQSKTELWIDAALRYTHPTAVPMSASGTMTRFAREYGICNDGSCGDNYFCHAGLMDNVRIYSGALAAAQIADIEAAARCSIDSSGSACCPGDINSSGTVDGADVGGLLAFWGEVTNTTLPGTDINHDGVVNGADLGLLLSHWGACP